jgi:hypothetical protein
MLGLVGFGADTLASAGIVDPGTAEALKVEVRRRAEANRFFGHINYASLLARR